jgi:uncharacterized membrane protein YfhO
MEGIQFLNRFQKTYLYENLFFKEQAFFTGEVISVENLNEAISRISDSNELQFAVVEGGQVLQENHATADIHWLLTSPNWIELTVETPQKGLLVISQIWYPDWKARVDGIPVKLWKANGVFSAVYLDTGYHRVSLIYRPWLTYIGTVISLITIIFLSIEVIINKREHIQKS